MRASFWNSLFRMVTGFDLLTPATFCMRYTSLLAQLTDNTSMLVINLVTTFDI